MARHGWRLDAASRFSIPTARLSDDNFQQGMAALRTPGEAINQDDAVTEEIICSCLPDADEAGPAFPMSGFAVRAFKMATPPRSTSLPSPPSISFSDYWNALGQRARSRETPSGSRPRVGPPRSPSSSSDAPRSRTVAYVPCSRISGSTRLLYAA
jgi:hypothetical protein